jgi:integrase
MFERTAWRLAASTGLRRGELLGLRWQDVDLDAGRVSIRQTLTTVGNKVAFGEPKTARGKRNLAIDRVTIGALRSWRARQAQERIAFGQAWQDTSLVFCREDGSLIHPDTFSFWFDRHVRLVASRGFAFMISGIPTPRSPCRQACPQRSSASSVRNSWSPS